MVFRMMFLYLPHLPICWYGGFAANMGHRFSQIYLDTLLTSRHFYNLMKFRAFLSLNARLGYGPSEIEKSFTG
jgi:hypothetical protein